METKYKTPLVSDKVIIPPTIYKKEEMMFKLIYEDLHPDIGQTVELDDGRLYTLQQALNRRALLKDRYNWYSPGVRVHIRRIT